MKLNMDWKADLPPLPRWAIPEIRAQVADLVNTKFKIFSGTQLTTGVVSDMVVEVSSCNLLRPFGNDSTRMALTNMFSQDMLVLMTYDVMVRMAYQIVCNLGKLELGHPPKAFTGVPVAQWIPLEIVGVESAPSISGKPMAKVSFQIVAGEFAGYPASKICSARYLPVFAKQLGYTYKKSYDQPGHLLSLLLAAWCNPSAECTLQFEHFWMNTYMKTHNKSVVDHHYPEE